MAEAAILEKALWRMRKLLMAKPDRALVQFAPDCPLIVAGFFQTASGLGQSARNCVEALRASGLSPQTIDLSGAFDQKDLPYPADLEKLPRAKAGTLILHVNAPETERALFLLGLHRGAGWRVVGVWAWELDVMADHWLPAIQHLSEVWTPSEFVSGVFRPHLDIPVRTVPHFIPQPNPETYQSVAPFVSDASATTFLAMADGRSSFHRKNLLGSIATFRTAFEGRDDVRLLLKSRNLMEFGEFRKDLMALIQGDTRIELIDRNLSSAEIWRLMHDSDCMLSPHRSEGFGIHLAEAMQIGRPVIATGWSGNTQFMTDENSLLIDYELQPVSDPFNVYSGLDRARWAEPDISSCVAAMRTIADNEDKRKEVGFLAQSSVRSCLGPEAWEKALKAPTQNLVV